MYCANTIPHDNTYFEETFEHISKLTKSFQCRAVPLFSANAISRHMESIIELLDVWNNFSREFSTIFVLLSVLALTVPFVPLLEDLACHGKRKTFKSRQGGLDIAQVRGVKLSFPVLKSYFQHMYFVGSVAGGFYSLLALRILLFKNGNFRLDDTLGYVTIQGMIMFEVHCIRRLYECLFMTKYGSSTMDITAYLVGILHYILVPSTIFCSLLKRDMDSAESCNSIMLTIMRLSSLLLFVVGNFSQFKCHQILFNLKQKKCDSSIAFDENSAALNVNCICNKLNSCDDRGKHGTMTADSYCNRCQCLNSANKSGNKTVHLYSFPRGFGFDYVVCPHYTAEIVIYISFLMLDPASSSLRCLLLWVTSNLSVVADSQFHWYLEKFPEETKKKSSWKRLIPGLW